jgi:hypothetical protein
MTDIEYLRELFGAMRADCVSRVELTKPDGARVVVELAPTTPEYEPVKAMTAEERAREEEEILLRSAGG